MKVDHNLTFPEARKRWLALDKNSLRREGFTYSDAITRPNTSTTQGAKPTESATSIKIRALNIQSEATEKECEELEKAVRRLEESIARKEKLNARLQELKQRKEEITTVTLTDEEMDDDTDTKANNRKRALEQSGSNSSSIEIRPTKKKDNQFITDEYIQSFVRGKEGTIPVYTEIPKDSKKVFLLTKQQFPLARKFAAAKQVPMLKSGATIYLCEKGFVVIGKPVKGSEPVAGPSTLE